MDKWTIARSYLTLEESPVYVPTWTKWKARNIGRQALFLGRCPDWTGYLKFYLTFCKNHQLYFITYGTGYEEVTRCPKCRGDWIAELNRK